MGTLSHTRMLTVLVDALAYTLPFLTSIFYTSHKARVYDIFRVTL